MLAGIFARETGQGGGLESRKAAESLGKAFTEGGNRKSGSKGHKALLI